MGKGYLIGEGVGALLSSVSHIGNTAGINAVFHRVKALQPSGEVLEVPMITGNSLRGQLRDHAAQYMLEILEIAQTPLDRFYLFFSGGALSKGSEMSLEDVHQMRELCPPLALFGGAASNTIMQGKLKCGMVVPIARETQLFLPHHLHVTAARVSVFDAMQNEAYTRFDDAKSQLLQQYINFGDNTTVITAPQQMRYEVETMAAGTGIYWRFAIEMMDENMLEWAVLLSALWSWSKNPVLGGKSSVGHGSVEMEISANGHSYTISPYIDFGGQADVASWLAQYNDYLLSNKNAILKLLKV